MGEVWMRIAACIPCACFFFLATFRLLGIAQQVGYKNGGVFRWLKRKDNLFFNRLTLWTVMWGLSSAIVALCFSALGVFAAKLCAGVPFLLFAVLFLVADRKYALKVSVKKTGRVKRLAVVYLFLILCATFLWITLCAFLDAWIAKKLYSVFAYAPVAVMPLALPFLFMLANAITGVFENARNRRFVKRAGQVLDETEIIRVAIVGSYGKTSVKNILAKLLSRKYSVVATPESFNTPIGIAKTVFSDEFVGKQVLIAEMGARRIGDIAELCELVKPDYAIFTGVCAQHVESFGSEENVYKAKSEILGGTKRTVVCGKGVLECAAADGGNVCGPLAVEKLELLAAETRFDLLVGEERIGVSTKLLGEHNAENIALAAALAVELGLTAEELAEGISEISCVPHRLELLEKNGVYILDDAYNANEIGAKGAIDALGRFEGRKWLVTPGIVEGGILEEEINCRLGENIAAAGLDRVILVGETLVGAVKSGYSSVGGDMQRLTVVNTLDKAQVILGAELAKGDCVLFLNDLPDAF